MFKKIFVTSFLFLTCAAFAENYEVDTVKSKIEWTGRKLAGSHNGTLSLKSSNIVIEKGEIQKGSKFIVDMKSLRDLDLKDEKMNKQLTGHLASDDFFSIEKFPESNFVVKTIKKVDDKNFILNGDLEIKGIKNEVAVPVVIKQNGNIVEGDAQISLDRTKWNVRFGSGKFFQNLGDKIIKDEFDLKITIIANKK